jgi:hypothetical protein
MTLELNREYQELDDPKIFEHMVNLTRGQMKPIQGHLRRHWSSRILAFHRSGWALPTKKVVTR